MIEYTQIISGLLNMAFIAAFIIPVIAAGTLAMIKGEQYVTQRRQHRDTLAEIRRLKADQAYAALADMAGYLRTELKHGGHAAAEYTAYEHCQKNFWGILENNGIHLDEEYQ